MAQSITPSNIFKDQDRGRSVGKAGEDWKYKFFSYLLLTVIAFTMIVPFMWMLSTSIKPETEILRRNIFRSSRRLTIITRSSTARICRCGTRTPSLSRSSARSAWPSLTRSPVSSSPSTSFPGKRPIFIIFLTSLMVPTEMLLIPWFIMSSNPPIGGTWVDTYWGIAFPGVITAAGIFLMRQFMQGVPDELLDAGRIDGVSEFGLFWRVAVPLSLPAIGALCIFNFLGNWNAFIWPLIATTRSEMFTLPVGIQQFSSEADTPWNLIMTGASLSVVPLLLVVIIFQRYIIEGIALTGLKG